MTPSLIRANVVAERISWIRRMLASIQGLPLQSYDAFLSDRRNVAAAESYLRRGIEALLDLGRHILAKGFALAVTEYKDIGYKLAEEKVLSQDHGNLLRQIAGYRNRMVHFYHEISNEELYRLCTEDLKDLETILAGLIAWLHDNPNKLDELPDPERGG
jgi:uncharacterized protein YutE (UPF0331/DUF86 family)